MTTEFRHGQCFAALTFLLVAVGLNCTPGAVGSAHADDKVSALEDKDIELTPAEKAERDARAGCKADICRAFRASKTQSTAAAAPGANDLKCHIVKSWRKAQLDKIVGKLKVSWPYGPVVCTTDITLNRDDMAKALSADKLEMTLPSHDVACVVQRDKGEPTDIKISFAPKVTFEGGKAVKASVNWGTVKAPTMVKGLLWTATAADNTANLLSGMLVDDINGFVTTKCDEIRETWAAP